MRARRHTAPAAVSGREMPCPEPRLSGRKSTMPSSQLLFKQNRCVLAHASLQPGLGANPLLVSKSQAQAENKTAPTSRDRAEPLVPRVPPPIPRPLLLSHHRPLFLHLALAGLAVLAVFCFFSREEFLWLFAFWHFWPFCLFGILAFWAPTRLLIRALVEPKVIDADRDVRATPGLLRCFVRRPYILKRF